MPLDVLVGLTALSLVPLLLVMCTSFVRIVVVLSLVRSAIGASALPPNAVLTGLALVLTFVVMAPTAQRIDREAVDPVCARRDPARASDRARDRSAAIVHAASDARRGCRGSSSGSRGGRRNPAASAPIHVLVPAFVVGELRSGFAIGFALYLAVRRDRSWRWRRC